jgi:hypothetical protein
VLRATSISGIHGALGDGGQVRWVGRRMRVLREPGRVVTPRTWLVVATEDTPAAEAHSSHRHAPAFCVYHPPHEYGCLLFGSAVQNFKTLDYMRSFLAPEAAATATVVHGCGGAAPSPPPPPPAPGTACTCYPCGSQVPTTSFGGCGPPAADCDASAGNPTAGCWSSQCGPAGDCQCAAATCQG